MALMTTFDAKMIYVTPERYLFKWVSVAFILSFPGNDGDASMMIS